MAEQKAATKSEQAEAQLAALAEERAGYQARLDRVKGGGEDRLSADQISSRVKDVEAEEKRLGGLLGKKKGES